ncbi:MAG TPA: M1 family aminopeptidase [Gemmatimonadales bacterium]|nr:M1 family aminopeptidase [Gemmatimonadales bacterium]
MVRWFVTLALGCAFAVVPGATRRAGLQGQATGSAQSSPTYLERYREIASLKPLPGQVAAVDHLVLRRDAGTLTLERGALYILSPVGGRTVGAVFEGQGRFTFASPVPTEQAELERFASTPNLDVAFSEVVLIFADSTAADLRRLAFGIGEIPGDVADHVHDLLASLQGEKEGSFRADVMGPLLNGETTGFFLARVERVHGGAVLFQVDPEVTEAVQLYHPVSRRRWGENWAVVTEFPPERPSAGTAGAWRYRERLRVPSYRVEIRLTQASSGALDFAASATLGVSAAERVGPWLRFGLHPKLVVDSARWGDGAAAPFFKAREYGDVWVRADRGLHVGDSLALTLFYHGDLIDRYGNWFFIDPLADWYPVNGQGPNIATFDLTYHSPGWYPLASIGERVDSTLTDKVVTTHWVARRPTSYASFNLGVFENYHVQQPGAPPLDVLLSEQGHRELARQAHEQGVMMLEQSHMRENVAADVSNSLKLYTHLFGDPPYTHFYVTEIPYGEGVSFPGLIDLSWSTFQNTSLDGFDEYFRAHEVAHQWWGNGVHGGSYRDAWLSEGLATFSALWYLQTVRKHGSDDYFKYLDQYKTDIKDDKDDAGPIWIGYRTATPTVRSGYDVMIYEKGAWVFHMLRALMLDLGTVKEDRFLGTMRDYYQSYRGKPATTDDFQSVVEQHAGIPMGWFFDEWVRGTAIPTYHVAWTSQPAADGKFAVHLRVTQEHVPPDFRMPVLVSVDLGENRFAHFRIDVRGTQTEYVSPLLPAAPKNLTFNDFHSVLADVKMERW